MFGTGEVTGSWRNFQHSSKITKMTNSREDVGIDGRKEKWTGFMKGTGGGLLRTQDKSTVKANSPSVILMIQRFISPMKNIML